jgi:PfaD family protein
MTLAAQPQGPFAGLSWNGNEDRIQFSSDQMTRLLLELDKPVWAVRSGENAGLTLDGAAVNGKGLPLIAGCPALPLEALGDPDFRSTYGTRVSYYTGAMANGIASEQLVIASGKAGILASFGAGGLGPQRVEQAIQAVQAALPGGPYAFNLLNSPNEPALEERAVDLYLKHGVRVIEASAYLALTLPLVRYRAAGLARNGDGSIRIGNRVIAKLSRLEMAQRFLEPAPADLLAALQAEGKISAQQAELARLVPMADDITVEADSGGHTDNRPLVCMLPAFLSLRDQVQAAHGYTTAVRVGAAGGIGTPEAVLAAFALGAAYVATGSVNQSCVESGTSEHVRSLLGQMEMPDVSMAPAGDMFEMGVKVQVLKRGTMFAMRAQKLYDLYSRYNAWEEIPQTEREKLEKTVFKREFDAIWNDTAAFFAQRDPRQVERGNANPRDKMALVFRWYLGLSSRWALNGEKGRMMDYQVWAGPSQGAFNEWVKGTYLADPKNRRVVDVALQLLTGCAYLRRLQLLEAQGVRFPAEMRRYSPSAPLI